MLCKYTSIDYIRKNKKHIENVFINEALTEDARDFYYVYFQNRQNPGITLNKTGETKVPIGSNKYLTITKLEEKAGKTYIYYKSDDFIDGFLPFFFKDDSENMYMRNMDESVIAPSGKDGFEVYDEPLLSKNLKVINNTVIYYDKEFTIDLK